MFVVDNDDDVDVGGRQEDGGERAEGGGVLSNSASNSAGDDIDTLDTNKYLG